MGYTSKPGMCRIDFFHDGGKWYATEELDMAGHYGGGALPPYELLPEACINAMRGMPDTYRCADGRMRFGGMWAVVLKPYHTHKHPQMFKVPERFDP